MSRRLFRWGLLAAFLLQTMLLAWLIVDRAMLLSGGKEISLKVVPVDPRDFFRGDYVVLAYEISRLNQFELDGDSDFENGDSIYVSLEPDGDSWRAHEIFHEKPSIGLFLRGTVKRRRGGNGDCEGARCRVLTVEYGLERFFVPEGEGWELEALRNDQKMSVVASVGENGRSALKRLLIDNQVRYEENLY